MSIFDRFESAADFAIGKTRHWALPSGYEVGSPVALLGSVGTLIPLKTTLICHVIRAYDKQKNRYISMV